MAEKIWKSPFGVQQVPAEKKATAPKKEAEIDKLLFHGDKIENHATFHRNFLSAKTEIKQTTNSPAPTTGSDPQIESLKKEISDLFARHKISEAEHEKFLALDAELEKKRNDAFELRQRQRDADHEKIWGKKKDG